MCNKKLNYIPFEFLVNVEKKRLQCRVKNNSTFLTFFRKFSAFIMV